MKLCDFGKLTIFFLFKTYKDKEHNAVLRLSCDLHRFYTFFLYLILGQEDSHFISH